MAIQKRPDEKIFASKAGSQEVSAFPDVERGWGFTFEQTGGIPTMEHFNALFKRIDEHFNYMLQRGLPEWSATLDYPVGAYVQYDNKTYRAKKASKNQRPDVVDSTYWVRWSIDYKEVSNFIDEAGKKGVPLGSVVAFPKHITPHGYLKAVGGTFNQTTYPDLYVANGNSNVLPNLNRSDVGMTAYFPFDEIPSGWIAFDSIRSTVTQQSYPELYQYLVAKYGSISQVPLADDRFIRNVNNKLRVGQTQESSFEHHHGIGRIIANNDAGLIIGEWQDQNHKSIIVHGQEAYIDIRNVNGDAESGGSRPLRTAKENAQGEVRPKSIALKLCIKAKNTFDDVQFWIKAFGTIENAGVLDAGTLAQNLQQTNQKIQDVENTLNRIEQLSSLNSTSTRKIWQGNVVSESSILSLSESIANKNIILYLQPSSSHSLNNNDVITISFFVDQKLSEARHKRFLNTAFYDSAWRSLKVEVVNDRQIKLVESSGFFLKAITVS